MIATKKETNRGEIVTRGIHFPSEVREGRYGLGFDRCQGPGTRKSCERPFSAKRKNKGKGPGVGKSWLCLMS